MQVESHSCNDEMRVAGCTHLVEKSVGNQFFVNRGWKEIPRKGGQSNLKLLQFNNVSIQFKAVTVQQRVGSARRGLVS